MYNEIITIKYCNYCQFLIVEIKRQYKMKCTIIIFTLFLIVACLLFPSLLLSSEEQFGRSSELSNFKRNENLIEVFSTLIEKNPSDYHAYNKRGVEHGCKKSKI